MMLAWVGLDQLDRWARQMGPHLGVVGIAAVVVLLIEGRMLQDAIRKTKVKEPSYFVALLVATISIPPCLIIGFVLSFIPLLGWIAGLVLSFALVGGLCAFFFGCTWGEGFYAAFWWWLYHLIFLLVIGGILLAISVAFGIAVANR